jgi:hypothetical protein
VGANPARQRPLTNKKEGTMSRTTNDAIDMQNAMAAMEEIYEAWERERALNWISRNPSEAFMAAIQAAPKADKDALHS